MKPALCTFVSSCAVLLRGCRIPQHPWLTNRSQSFADDIKVANPPDGAACADGETASGSPTWLDAQNIVISDDGSAAVPQTAGIGWGSIGAVAQEQITADSDIIGVQFSCDDAADAMCGFNADHGDSSWQDLDFYFYCHPLNRAGVDGAVGTLVYYSDPTSGPEDVNLGVYSSSDVFAIKLNDAGALDFYMNGEIVHTSSVVPTLPLYVDVAMSAGATMTGLNSIQYVRKAGASLQVEDLHEGGGCGPVAVSNADANTESNCDRAYVLGSGFGK